MNMAEHIYHDDPSGGPADATTTIRGIRYYFLGNGFMEAAIQVCTSAEATPVGVLIMDPERFGPKRSAFSFDPDTGLEPTQVRFKQGKSLYQPDAGAVRSDWSTFEGVPAVKVDWTCQGLEVTERFYCPDCRTARLMRQVTVTNTTGQPLDLSLVTGIRDRELCVDLAPLSAGEQRTVFLEIRRDVNTDGLFLTTCETVGVAEDAKAFWAQTHTLAFGRPDLDFMFRAASNQLQATVAHNGAMDASIWQYNLEWVRDAANVAMGLVLIGQFERARAILHRLLTQYTTEEGDTADSSQVRPTSETELDQNGILLLALKTYHDWSGDSELIRQHWTRIRAVADFPLKPVFQHPSGLLHNEREYWERHAAHGVDDGMEFCYQMLVSMGLDAAVELARVAEDPDPATRWQKASARLKSACLTDPDMCLVEAGHLIKRRRVDGSVQHEFNPTDADSLHPGVPLAEEGPHPVNPDAQTALAVALEWIDPTSDLALRTLDELERLKNIDWEGGGYARYNIMSEPDSPGPWPMASLQIAQANWQAGRAERTEAVLDWLNALPGAESGTWFEFYGPRPIPPCPQIGMIPWNWAELLKLLVHHILGARPMGQDLVLFPRFPSDVDHMDGTVRFRDTRITVRVLPAGEAPRGVRVDGGEIVPVLEGPFVIPNAATVQHVEIYI